MTGIIYFLVLFLSIASAAGVILLSGKLRSSYNHPSFDSIFYYVILFTLFGFYGLWGTVITHYILSLLSAPSLVIRAIGHLIPLFGFPFLLMGGFMLLKSGYELFNKGMRPVIIFLYFSVYIFLLILLGWYSFTERTYLLIEELSPVFIVMIFYIIQELSVGLWYFIKGISYLTHQKSRIKSGMVKWFLLIFISLLIIKILVAGIAYFTPEYIPLFILLYFLSIVVPVLYLYIKIDKILYEIQPGYTSLNTRQGILQKFGITNREREIIDLVCSGKSNQEIADLLFISLQTVKDHTHRIYLKMEVKNRMQLLTAFQQIEN